MTSAPAHRLALVLWRAARGLSVQLNALDLITNVLSFLVAAWPVSLQTERAPPGVVRGVRTRCGILVAGESPRRRLFFLTSSAEVEPWNEVSLGQRPR